MYLRRYLLRIDVNVFFRAFNQRSSDAEYRNRGIANVPADPALERSPGSNMLR